MWEVEYTEQFGAWWGSLDHGRQERVAAAVELLEEHGPALGRPIVDSIKGSRHQNMKELRPRGGHLRVLFAFDARRVAVLLLGGDKTGRWSRWYAEVVPLADLLLDQHTQTLTKERPRHEED